MLIIPCRIKCLCSAKSGLFVVTAYKAVANVYPILVPDMLFLEYRASSPLRKFLKINVNVKSRI